jgi:hypothetical protein
MNMELHATRLRPDRLIYDGERALLELPGKSLCCALDQSRIGFDGDDAKSLGEVKSGI